MDPADRLEQPQVRAAQPFLVGDLDQSRGPRVLHLVDRVAQPGDEPALPRVRRTAASASASHPASSVGRSPSCSVEYGVQVAAAVLGHAEEPRPAPEQPGGHRALQRVGRGEVGEPGRDRRRGEAVVGQRDQHRLEHPRLAGVGRRSVDQPERQLAEPDLAHQVAGETLPQQADLLGRRRPQ